MNLGYMRNLSIGGIIDYALQEEMKKKKANDPHKRVMMHRVYTLDEVDRENVVSSQRVIAKYGKDVVYFEEFCQCFPKKSELKALTPVKMKGIAYHHIYSCRVYSDDGVEIGCTYPKEEPFEIEVYELRGKKWITHEMLKSLYPNG